LADEGLRPEGSDVEGHDTDFVCSLALRERAGVREVVTIKDLIPETFSENAFNGLRSGEEGKSRRTRITIWCEGIFQKKKLEISEKIVENLVSDPFFS
jgi:hypothetical protein